MMLFVPLGVFLAIETLEDEWYVVIKAYRFTIFERVLCIIIHFMSSTISTYIAYRLYNGAKHYSSHRACQGEE